jgi:hypothetical protein
MQTIERLNAIPAGRFISTVWKRQAKTRKGFEGVIEKQTAANGLQWGVEYDNKAVIQEKRENGELPAVNAGLNGMEWVSYPKILRGVKSGKLCVRFHLTKKTRFAVNWLLNGKRVSKEEILPFLLASEQSSGEKPDAINVGIDSILAVKGH